MIKKNIRLEKELTKIAKKCRTKKEFYTKYQREYNRACHYDKKNMLTYGASGFSF